MLACEECGSENCEAYEYPGGEETHLCEKHATGLFCLGCGAFIGGTENIFLHGPYECEFCRGWQEDDMPDEYQEWEY